MPFMSIPKGSGKTKQTVMVSGRKKIMSKGKTILVTIKPAVPPERWLEIIERLRKG